MSAVIKTLKNIFTGHKIYPVTKMKAVFDEDGNRLDHKLEELNSRLDNVSGGTLVWENPSPTSSFSPQTITLDLSKYQFIEIYWTQSSNDTVTMTEKCIVGRKGVLVVTTTSKTGTPITTLRSFTINTNNIVFADAAIQRGSETTRNWDNSYNIPYKIYGIK